MIRQSSTVADHFHVRFPQSLALFSETGDHVAGVGCGNHRAAISDLAAAAIRRRRSLCAVSQRRLATCRGARRCHVMPFQQQTRSNIKPPAGWYLPPGRAAAVYTWLLKLMPLPSKAKKDGMTFDKSRVVDQGAGSRSQPAEPAPPCSAAMEYSRILPLKIVRQQKGMWNRQEWHERRRAPNSL